MAVGNQATKATIDNVLSSLAVQLREICDQIRRQETFIGTLGTAGLEAAGYSAADAATAQQMIGFMNSIAAVYYGTGTQPAASNFDQALSALWAGQ